MATLKKLQLTCDFIKVEKRFSIGEDQALLEEIDQLITIWTWLELYSNLMLSLAANDALIKVSL